ncbi:hypothetical protein [Paludibaculum fermentans]|uniref:Uncharacterized protein n=1 Tax=Paludibaculum fermentans TaxID=1473598 RepID=A0A7S7SKE6_PALFE|nr:hypothetical protein [Paludibaculum fermentans]QOY88224.1 hypothetical protein IRI77_36730 [Paludibaculum fermentans]
MLEPFRMFLEMKGFDLPSGANQEIDATTLGGILAQPDEDMPGDLVEALHLIGSIGSDERFDELLDLAGSNQIETDGEVTALDLATQIWLKNPEALERKEHEEFFQKRKSFESFRAAAPDDVMAVDDLPADLSQLEASLDAYFQAKKRGVGCRIMRKDSVGEVRFLVEHGQPCKREPSRKGPRSTSTFFRPEKTDVVIYDAIHNELRINASTFADVREYRVQFGRHVFGGEDKFVFAEKYTLDPLKEDGRAALNCRDIAGLDTVKLREIEYSWGGAFEHFEVHRAESLFHALALIQRTIEAEAQIRKAVFKIKLDDEKKPRTVTIKAGNKSGYNRGEEAMVIEDWLRARGFVITEEGAADAQADAALAGD